MQIMTRYKNPSTEEFLWWGRSANAKQYKIQEIVRILSDLDAQHNLALTELQRGPLSDEAQDDAIEKLRTEHRGRRSPYLRRLEELRECGGLPALGPNVVQHKS